ncbi:hypothetical protein [Nocardia arthritidis]|uniref:ABM domain-containing protein n=1 Tax=Nocardia arthritidis TaxID=228602 RepID=A0A6G9YCL9_9NOCA|nr:hypothetical protein [Nocardia arthritidis]QIS10880.1 hypothetical protein F5544_14980 [Nocardia arthritidis]
MPQLIIRYAVTEDAGAAEVAAAVESAFQALHAAAPAGVRFTYGRVTGTKDFVALLELDEGVENPLPAIEAARALQATVGKWAVGSPAPVPFELLGSYGINR